MNSRDENVSFVNSPRFNSKSVDWIENFIFSYSTLFLGCVAFTDPVFFCPLQFVITHIVFQLNNGVVCGQCQFAGSIQIGREEGKCQRSRETKGIPKKDKKERFKFCLNRSFKLFNIKTINLNYVFISFTPSYNKHKILILQQNEKRSWLIVPTPSMVLNTSSIDHGPLTPSRTARTRIV